MSLHPAFEAYLAELNPLIAAARAAGVESTPESARAALAGLNQYALPAVEVAQAARDAGAAGLCVALVGEGVELRRAGVQGPILVLSEQPVEQLDLLVAHRLTPTICSAASIASRGSLRAAAIVSSMRKSSDMTRSCSDSSVLRAWPTSKR